MNSARTAKPVMMAATAAREDRPAVMDIAMLAAPADIMKPNMA